jgi:Arc/MetJ family transcription regulator
MKINIDINDKLMAQAQRLTGITDKNVLIEKALQLFISLESQKKLIGLAGKIKIDDKAYR